MTLTAGELTQARLDAEELLPSTCTIQTRSTSADGQGGVTESWSDATAVPCRLDPVSVTAKSSTSGDKFTIHDVWTLYVHWDRSIAYGRIYMEQGSR